MIRVQFVYETKTEDLQELFSKFQQSGAEEFNSSPSNKGITVLKKESSDITTIMLEIDYASVEDYEARTKFERSQAKWNEIWFADDIKHKLISIEVFEIL